MNQYAPFTPIPSQFKMVNAVQSSGELKKDSSCQPSFTYFPKGETPQVNWGSEKPMKEVCPPSYKPLTGTPNHAIWNNSTKRKTIVRY